MSCKGCSDCVETKCLPVCLSNIIVGVFEPDTDYYIYLENATTGQLLRFESTTDGNGKLEFSLGFEPMPDQSYKLWVTETNQNIDHEEEIIIPYGYYTSDSTADCLALRFVYVEDTDLNKILYHTIQLEVEQ